MKTISLRYTDKFAPRNGTIAAHKELIKVNGFVWYGKMGAAISKNVSDMLLESSDPKFLLIHSGFIERYWVHFDCISREIPPFEQFPEYYHGIAKNFNTWFRVTSFENADKNVISKCVVSSSRMPLSEASKHSMSPYFIIDYKD